jgi:hypothetical protein
MKKPTTKTAKTVRMSNGREGGIANVPEEAVPVWEAAGWKIDPAKDSAR